MEMPWCIYRGDESGKELVGGVLRRELPAVTVFSVASPGTNELTGKGWEQAVTQLALCLTPGEKEPQGQDSFLKTELARKRMCLFLACF